MAYTVSALTTQVQNRLDDTGFSSTIILQFLNDAQRDFLNDRMNQVMEKSIDYVLTPQNSDLTSGAGLPSDFQTVIDLRITSPQGLAKSLHFMPYKEFDIEYPQPTLFGYTVPFIYTRFGNTLTVFPSPASNYTLSLRYYKTPVELVNTTDVPEIPSEWQELLVLGVLKRCHELNDNYDMASIVQGKIDELLNQFTVRMSMGKMQPAIMKLNGNSVSRR